MRNIYILLLLFLVVGCSKDDFMIEPEGPSEPQDSIKAPVVITGMSISLDSLLNIGLPVVFITTENAEEPTYTKISHPVIDGDPYMGISITNTNKVPGRLWIQLKDSVFYDSGDFVEDESGMRIRVRGNQMASRGQHPFKVKLQKKADLLCRDEMYKDKNWLLMRSSSEHNPAFGFMANKAVGLQYAPSFEYVNVVFNNDYRGLYLLCESVSRNKKCRLNVSDTGFIFEWDAYWWNEDMFMDTKFSINTGAKFTFKYPEVEDMTPAKYGYLQRYLSAFESHLEDETYSDYIDVESLIRWTVGHDILGGRDGIGSNMYFTKYDDTSDSKIIMGCMWDFDTMMEREDVWSASHYNCYLEKLFANNADFRSRYADFWYAHSDSIVNEILESLNEYYNTYSYKVNQSRELHKQRWTDWGGQNPPLSEDVNKFRQWIKSRKDWMDKACSTL